MKNRPRVIIVVGNHKHFDGIRDIVHMVAQLLSVHFDIVISLHPISGLPNVIIEEFTSRKFTKKLRAIKLRSPDTKFVLVMTEIPSEQRSGLMLNADLVNGGFFTPWLALASLHLIQKVRDVFFAHFHFNLLHKIQMFMSTIQETKDMEFGFNPLKFFFLGLRHFALRIRRSRSFPRNLLFAGSKILFRGAKIAKAMLSNYILTLNTYINKSGIRYSLYMKLRAGGLQSIIPIFDYCLTTHPEISRQTNKFMPNPKTPLTPR